MTLPQEHGKAFKIFVLTAEAEHSRVTYRGIVIASSHRATSMTRIHKKKKSCEKGMNNLVYLILLSAVCVL